jgi:hypothetical protein
MNTLLDVAFGADPGRWPLPSAETAEEHWLRAVASGGQGRYATARAELDTLARVRDGGPFLALSLSTRASFLRQLGWHSHARKWDGRALILAGPDADARADALIGLAADALGVGQFPLSARLLARAGDVVGAGASARLPVRLAWVSAELAMATGDGAAAVGHAERGVALAAALDSVRHAVKSDVVLAAAWCCAGQPERSRGVADTALQAAEEHGLIPLTWALASLLVDVGSGALGRPKLVTLRDDCAAAVQARGGVWSNF